MTANICMAICHTLMMALSPDLSGGERKSHQLSDTKIVLPWHCVTLLHPSVWLSALICTFTKSAYFPGEKITRTQMLNRVSAKSFTWLMNQSCICVSWHLKERSHSSHTCMSTAVTPVQHSSWQLSWSHLSEGPEISTFKKVLISRVRK